MTAVTLSDKFFQSLVADALAIREIIYSHGGMATKSAVEDVLMNKHRQLEMNRYWPHMVMNHIEQQNAQIPDRRFSSEPRPSLDEWRVYFDGVDCHWYRGDPFRETI